MRRDNSENSATTSTRSMWSRGSLSAGALLATAMLLLAFAPFAHAAQPEQNLREWNARWAVLSATFGDTLGSSSEAQTRVQSEQLWRWMQSRVVTSGSQNLSPQQVARWLHEWQTQSGIELSTAKATNDASSTQAPCVLASQLPAFPLPQVARPVFATRRVVASLHTHEAGHRAGVRSNRSHE